jgi:hypothetical protein
LASTSEAKTLTPVALPPGRARLWHSRDWPLVGDAAILRFIAVQIKMGAVPYRDIADVNMPLTYGIHVAVVTMGCINDAAWRAFDLMAIAIETAV